ncbi:hypothetical protein CDL12_10693 [Handroanthus impetiginosus]|uniref:Uncharacterized protein n=1 Tax=Handroanthus impetiginosus TaxID=429701 RepID=A0A2G9HGG9_9LAMI|nr:hypothetical protein CDL12_10693 [Handroanthus impetiginosus]
MFTEGLDESAINWIKKGSDVEQCQTRSPLTEKLDTKYPLPRSPLSYASSNYTSSHILPPLKFHSNLLKPLNTVTLSAESNGDDSDYYNDDESESVGSAPDEICGNHFDDDDGVDTSTIGGFEEDIFNLNQSQKMNERKYASTINRGLSKEDLHIKVPGSLRRFTDGAWGSKGCGPSSVVSGGSCQLQENNQPHSAYKCDDLKCQESRDQVISCDKGTPIGAVDLGTPSAPPFMDMANVHDLEGESDKAIDGQYKEQDSVFSDDKVFLERSKRYVKTEMGVGGRDDEETPVETEHPAPVKRASSVNHIPYYHASGQNAYQALVAYDACIRLCLNAWARGRAEAPEFLRDECLLLRDAFGLHKLLLQPRGVQQTERDNKNTEQAMASKVKRTVGKIRVEVKKLRIIPRRKLKNTNSMIGAIYLQAGAEYVRHVSSIVKNRISSLKLSSFALPCEESLVCMIHLKSLAEDNEMEPGSSISLQPGTGEYHDFFPESQGDALLLEVQDAMKNVQGCATIPISSLTDNPNDKVRWWHIYHNDHECVGKILLSIGSTFTNDDTTLMKKSILLDCETQVEALLAEAFQNYKSLDESSPIGLADISAPISETAAPALAPAVQLYTLLHDILAQDAQTMLRKYLQSAAMKRCRKHMLETDEFVSSNSEGFIMDSDSISKAYLKIKNLCINISNEIHIDIKIHNQHIFPSSIDLSTLTSAVYSTELSKRLGAFLAAWPPSSPMPHVNELLIAMSDFERSLELWNISPVQGGVDARDLYHDYIMVWIQDLQLTLLDLCKAEKVPWYGVVTKYSTSPFAEDMFEKLARMLSEYEVVINRWPQYTLFLENMQANRNTRLRRILEDTKEADGEAQIRERTQLLSTQLSDCISNLHETFTGQILVATCRAFWDKMGQIVLKFLEGRKENRVWYTGSYHALGILDDIYASQMQRLLGNALQEKDLEPPRSITEARSILSRDNTNKMESLYF